MSATLGTGKTIVADGKVTAEISGVEMDYSNLKVQRFTSSGNVYVPTGKKWIIVGYTGAATTQVMVYVSGYKGFIFDNTNKIFGQCPIVIESNGGANGIYVGGGSIQCSIMYYEVNE